ncbi:Bax inhibitor-1 family protein [Pseudomonas luteola]
MFESDVFERTGSDTISSSMYNLVLGGVLAWGFALNYLMIQMIPAASLNAINPILFLIGYFVCALVGTLMVSGSQNPVVSFIGYNLIVIPIGCVLIVILPGYSQAIIAQAIQTTAILTVTMMALGTVFPKFFMGLGRALFWSLLACIVIELIQMLVFKVKMGFMDWIVAFIFCLYIGFDWARANSIPKTVDNAIDSAAALYLDIINLFVRLLQIIKALADD